MNLSYVVRSVWFARGNVALVKVINMPNLKAMPFPT